LLAFHIFFLHKQQQLHAAGSHACTEQQAQAVAAVVRQTAQATVHVMWHYRVV
jgi:hypothetical protein